MKLVRTERKPVTSLTVEDLDRYPIWEFTLDEETDSEQDESFVRPVMANSIPLDRPGLFVAADLLLADGITVPGHILVNDDRVSDIPDAVLIFEGRYLNVPHSDDLRERKRFARYLRREEHQIFPIRYKLRLSYEGDSTLNSGVLA